MTTKNFCTLTLPSPKCSLEVGSISIDPNQRAKSSWIPKFSDITQIVEVRQTGTAYPSRLADEMKHVIGSYIVIENARPELFLRRDFIKRFVHHGAVHLTQTNEAACGGGGDSIGSDYGICSLNNELHITMTEKQYRRFGLIAKKITPNRAKGTKKYLITCDLKDERIIKSDKYQDKLVQTFRRLNSLSRLYFRYVPKPSSSEQQRRHHSPSISEATNESLDFFQSVIDEYAADGFKPVPLTKCTEMRQTIGKKWLNCSQVHPNLNPPNQLGGLVDIIDWLGYQILSLDCDRPEIRNKYPDEQERLDVSCLQLSGMVDFKHIQEILGDIFAPREGVIMRALCLYGTQPRGSNVLIMNNGSPGPQSPLTVARLIKRK